MPASDPSARRADEGPHGDRPATGAGSTTFGAVDGGTYRQPPTDPMAPAKDAAGEDVAGTPNADRAEDTAPRDPAGASTPETPGF